MPHSDHKGVPKGPQKSHLAPFWELWDHWGLGGKTPYLSPKLHKATKIIKKWPTNDQKSTKIHLKSALAVFLDPGTSKKSLQEGLQKCDPFWIHSGTLKSGPNLINSSKNRGSRGPQKGPFWTPFWTHFSTIFDPRTSSKIHPKTLPEKCGKLCEKAPKNVDE